MQEAENDRKNPVVVYLDTTIGIPENRQYVQDLCDTFGWQLWTLRTHENFEEMVEKYGFPGPARHNLAYAYLKERQLSKLASIAEDPHFYTGIRRKESERRMRNQGEGKEMLGAVWHNPIADFTLEETKSYIESHNLPQNPLWDKGHFKDCGCGAFGNPEELLELQADYPDVYEKIKRIEESIDRDDEKSKWGWGQLSQTELRKIRAENDDMQMTLCSHCGLNKDGE